MRRFSFCRVYGPGHPTNSKNPRITDITDHMVYSTVYRINFSFYFIHRHLLFLEVWMKHLICRIFCCCLILDENRKLQILSYSAWFHWKATLYLPFYRRSGSLSLFVSLQQSTTLIHSPANSSWDLIRKSQATGILLSQWNVRLRAPSCHRLQSSHWARSMTSSHWNTWPAGHAIIVR